MDNPSLTYAQACQQIIGQQAKGAFPIEEACEKLIAIPKEAHVHPMLSWVEQYAYDIFHNICFEGSEYYEDTHEDKQERENDWQQLKQLVADYLAGKWRRTDWTLRAAYQKESHGYSLNVRRGFNRLKVEVANKTLQKALKQTISMLNNLQTDERMLQNLALVIPKEIEEYELAYVGVVEELA